MRAAPIVFCGTALLMGAFSIESAIRSSHPVVSTMATSTPSERAVEHIPRDSDGYNIVCSLRDGSAGTCDFSHMGPSVLDIPEYGASSTAPEIMRLAERVIPEPFLARFDELRIYARSESDTAGYVEAKDGGRWALGVTLDPHLFKEGGLDETSLEVTLAHELGHVVEADNSLIKDAFLDARSLANESTSTIARVMGDEAAVDADEDFAESYAMYLVKDKPIGASELWRMDVFAQKESQFRSEWRGRFDKGELEDLEEVWSLSHGMGRPHK